MLVSLAVIFSQCLRESRNPADWQIALVKTLFKKGDRHSWKNYRLISLLSVVGKLYESVLANRLSCLLDGRDRRGDHLLSQFQGGFRRGRSCQHQSYCYFEAPVGHPDRAGRRLLGACSFLFRSSFNLFLLLLLLIVYQYIIVYRR